VENEANVTVGCIEVPVEKAREYGVMKIDEQHRILDFMEKPDNPPTMPGEAQTSLCSMGIYVFNTEFLYKLLIEDHERKDSSHDFGKDIIPAAIKKHAVYAYPFRDTRSGEQCYWRDVGTVDAFWEANLELIGITPELNLYDKLWPIWTYQEQLPPAKFIFDDDDRRGIAIDSLVSGGCIISGSTIRHSLLFSNVYVDNYSEIDSTVILPEVTIGKNCKVLHAVLDRGCKIPDGMNIGINQEEDKKRFYVSPNGIVLVTPEMLGYRMHHVV
jgi:glucose-1-phosphate adenylyltransferase